jgi:GR25 family glycosyltransferase involved in LPS biosynthesis
MSIDYYLIHCDEHTKRLDHVESIQKKLPIHLFQGIYTKNVKIEEQDKYIRNFNSNIKILKQFTTSGEIGCYLSHFSLVDHIMKTSKTEYSVIFEDDVQFDCDLNEEIIQITKKLIDLSIDFDILFLGNLSKNKGRPIIDTIFYMDKNKPCWGTHALLIHNKNIEKIMKLNHQVKGAIDNHYVDWCKRNKLICLVLSPSICTQTRFRSTVR